jgi:hypothetical protein
MTTPAFVIARSLAEATRQSIDDPRLQAQRQAMDCFAFGSQ